MAIALAFGVVSVGDALAAETKEQACKFSDVNKLKDHMNKHVDQRHTIRGATITF